ncbi:hypothetical protein H9P43_005207 [Blastocladiella emersonii ATCC 22665]|nr:hypothetical protein H9P43_005207 [Blastocladiella emersonii ATCC 22665]
MPPITDGSGLAPYFLQLLCYAKYVIEHRTGEVVSHKTLSAPWRKDHWERLIRDGRQRLVQQLPNTASIDAWFELFRTFKRELGVRNVPARAYPIAAPLRSRPLADEDHFDRVLRAHLRAMAESDDEYRSASGEDEFAESETSSAASAASSSHHTGPIYLSSDSEDDDGGERGPMTRSRAAKRTVVASTYRNPSTPITRTSATAAPAAPATAPAPRTTTTAAGSLAAANANGSKFVISVEVESLRDNLKSMKVKQARGGSGSGSSGSGSGADTPSAAAGAGIVRTPSAPLPGSAHKLGGNAGSPWTTTPITPLTPAQSTTAFFRPPPAAQRQNAQQQTTPNAFGGAGVAVGVGNTPRAVGGLAGAAAPNETGFTPIGDVELLKLVASGGQASVFLARLPLDHNSLVIVKVFYKKPSAYEVAGMRAMSLTNYAIRLIGESRITRNHLLPFERDMQRDDVSMASFEFDARTGFLTGWCYERLQGDLEHCLLDKKTPIGNAMKQLVALQIAYFLRGVHSSGYIFRDLKPSNILLNTQLHNVPPQQVVQYFLQHYPVIKVTDFGLVTMEKESKKTRSAGTMGYMPANQMSTNDYDRSVDVTAYAITLAEILVEDLMFDINDRDEEIEDEFKSLRVIDRITARFARYRQYIPSALAELIYDTLRGNNRSIETFIAVLEASLKGLAFAFDVTKSDMQLLNQGMATPGRPILVSENGAPTAAAVAAANAASMGATTTPGVGRVKGRPMSTNAAFASAGTSTRPW